MPNLIINPYGLQPYGDDMRVLCYLSYSGASWDVPVPVALTTMDQSDPSVIEAELKASAKTVFEAHTEMTMQEGEMIHLIGGVV